MPIMLLSFFTGGWMRWAVLAFVVMAALAWERQHLINEGRQQVLAENQKAAIKIVAKQGAVTEKVVKEYVKVAGATKTVTNTIEKEVIRYETLKLDACPVSNAWIGLHDAAAANKIPDASKSTDATASGITAGEALGTVTGNYSRFHETADRLKALQDWIREQQAIQPDAPKKWWQR